MQDLSITNSQYPSRVNQTFLNIVADNSLEQLVDFPTRKQNTLDIILTTHPSFKQRCKPMPSIGNSDHDIVLFDTTLSARRPKPIRRKLYLWKKADVDGIRKDLTNLTDQIQENDSTDDSWMTLKKAILGSLETRVPSKMTTSRHTNPWMTTEIKRTIRQKQRAYKKALATQTKKDHDRYKQLQKKAQLMVRKANKNYLRNTVSGNYKDNAKKFWSYVKSKGQENSGVAPLKNKDGFLQSDTSSRANILNEQFKSAFTAENTSSIPDPGQSSIPSMPHITVDWKGVHKLLVNLRPHKATGPDSVPAFILKAAASQLAPALAKLFQKSLNTGEVPQEWRDALVVPIFKKGERHQPANYRPVSLTSITCKLLEHIVHSNIMQHFDRHRVLNDNQHGFRKRRSCETQLISTIQDIASSVAKGKQVDVILLDFAKAFDKVPHERLLRKLENYGVRDSTKRWIRSFLSHRSQQVVLDGVKSEPADVLSGVPQGTVLGPLLFLAFINDLPNSVKSSQSKLFADDSLLFKVIENTADSDLLQQDLSALESWEETWQMSFNPSKCTVLRIAPPNKKTIQTSYILHGHTLEIEEHTKYLGVTLPNSLQWDQHIHNVIGKGNRTLGFLRRNFRECTPPVKAATYTAMVRPSLEYASTVWDPTNQAQIKALEQVQRRAARYVFNDFHTKTPGCVTKMVEDLHWESLEERRRQNRLSMMFRFNQNLVDLPMDRYLRASDSRTRGSHKFFQERSRQPIYYNSFFPRTVREWNTLPTRVVSAASLDEFRSLLKV